MSMKKNRNGWVVDGADLRTRSRRGGRVALNGYEFQAAHAVHFITQLLTCEGGLVQVRYEGAQDIDLMFGDGRQLFIQYKETAGTEYTFDVMQDILRGFVCDAIDACGKPADVSRLSDLNLEFMLVSTGVFVDSEVMRIVRKTTTKKMADKLAKGFSYPGNPVTKADLKLLAEYVLKKVSVRLVPKLDGYEEPTLLATARLALFGVPPTRIGASLAKIRELLTPPRNSFAADVTVCLDGLPDFHPASPKSPIRILPSESTFPNRDTVEQEFLDSGRVTWAAIHYQLDTARDVAKAVLQDVQSFAHTSGLILVSGAAGSGKSTVIRRVAWELGRTGRALVFQITNPSALNNESWDEVTRISALAKKPAIVAIDDIGSHSQIFDLLRRTPYSNMIVIANDKNKDCIPNPLPIAVKHHVLGSISSKELAQLGVQLGKKISPQQKAKLSSFMQHGEMFALSLVLRGSSLSALAAQTLARVDGHVPELEKLFLSLCVCGVYDQSAPISLLTRILPSAQVWSKARNARLVFDEVNNRVRSGHAALAVSILENVRPDVARLKIDLLVHVDVSDIPERRFALGLLQNGLIEGARDLARFPAQLVQFASSISEVGDYNDLRRCTRMIQTVRDAGAPGLNDVLTLLTKRTAADRVRTGFDAVSFMKDSTDYEIAFPIIANVFASIGVSFGRSSFMRWVSEKGRGNVELQRQAVETQFTWLQANDFPIPETDAFVNCVVNGNSKLPDEVSDNYVKKLQSILAAIEFPFDSRPHRQLLYAFSEAISYRFRSQELYVTFFNVIRASFDDSVLVSDPLLLRNMIRAARLVGNVSARRDMFELGVRLLPQISAAEIPILFNALQSIVPTELKSTMVAWARKMPKNRLGSTAMIAQDFVNDVKLRMTP
jgi:hypothetical protein